MLIGFGNGLLGFYAVTSSIVVGWLHVDAFRLCFGYLLGF